MRIVLATSNHHKARELETLFHTVGLDVELVTLSDVGFTSEIIEDGSTFAENAFIKAWTVHEATGLPVLADDSGIEVDALDGGPGIYSARFAGPDATDADNRKHLCNEVRARGLDGSQARFRCVLCYIDPLRTLFGDGSVQGSIGLEERGSNGFGYDPLFTPVGGVQTFGEMSAEQKLSMSHRSAAAADLARHLSPLTTDDGHASDPDPLPKMDALIMACVAAVMDNDEHLRSAIRLFVRDADDARAVYEALLQTYLFAGFPVALESLAICDEEVRAILPNLSWSDAPLYDVDAFRERGEALCQQVYGTVYERMMERLEGITPDLSDWMIVEGYGKTLSREGLDVIQRELCNVAVLAVLQRVNQLNSHVRGALNVGANKEDVLHCADAVTEWAGKDAGDLIRDAVDRFA